MDEQRTANGIYRELNDLNRTLNESEKDKENSFSELRKLRDIIKDKVNSIRELKKSRDAITNEIKGLKEKRKELNDNLKNAISEVKKTNQEKKSAMQKGDMRNLDFVQK